MSALSPEQYEAIGRLTISFNHLEVAFELYTAYVLDTPEWSAGAALAKEGMFRQKADRFAKVLKAIGESHAALASNVASVIVLIQHAKRLADERNRYVHSFIVLDTISDTPRLKKGKEQIECDFNKINNIAGHADALSAQVHMQCAFLLDALDAERSKK
jgi:hypothetical protein